MLYRGNSVREAVGKALGVRDEFGRKIANPINRHPLGYKSAPIELEQNLANLRSTAIQNAKNYINNANIDFGEDEDGYVELYFVDNGEVHQLRGAQAGRPRNGSDGTPHFDYDLRAYRSRPFWVLCWAHSHTWRDRRDRSLSTQRLLSRPSDDDRNNLMPFAPLVIKSPPQSRQPMAWGEGGSFRQFNIV